MPRCLGGLDTAAICGRSRSRRRCTRTRWKRASNPPTSRVRRRQHRREPCPAALNDVETAAWPGMLLVRDDPHVFARVVDPGAGAKRCVEKFALPSSVLVLACSRGRDLRLVPFQQARTLPSRSHRQAAGIKPTICRNRSRASARSPH